MIFEDGMIGKLASEIETGDGHSAWLVLLHRSDHVESMKVDKGRLLANCLQLETIGQIAKKCGALASVFRLLLIADSILTRWCVVEEKLLREEPRGIVDRVFPFLCSSLFLSDFHFFLIVDDGPNLIAVPIGSSFLVVNGAMLGLSSILVAAVVVMMAAVTARTMQIHAAVVLRWRLFLGGPIQRVYFLRHHTSSGSNTKSVETL